MAIVASNLYAGRITTGEAGYPYGKARDLLNGEKGTGTPLRASWVNDTWGFLQALLDAADIIPSGTPDQVGQSDYLDAVNKLIREPLALKIFQSPSSEGLTEIQTRTVNANEVYEVRKTSDGSLATIYSDAAGTAEIVQNGTDNKSGGDGIVEFYIADGDYYVEVVGVKSNFETSLKNEFETVDDAKNYSGIAALSGSRVYIISRQAYFEIVLTSTVAPNDMDIIESSANSNYSYSLDCGVTIFVNNLGYVMGDVSSHLNRIKDIQGYVKLKVGNYTYGGEEIALSESEYIEGSGIKTVLTPSYDTGAALISRGSFSGIKNLSLNANRNTFNGSLIKIENNGFNTYQQFISDCYMRTGENQTTGTAIDFDVQPDIVTGIIQPKITNVQIWRATDAISMQTNQDENGAYKGFVDVGKFENLRFSLCENWINHKTIGINRMVYENCVGAYDNGVSYGFINRGFGNTYRNCFMFDYSFEYLYIKPESTGTIIGEGTTRGSMSISDRGFKTQFTGNKTNASPTNPGGLGFLEWADNCMGYDVSNNWNIDLVGLGSARYFLNVSSLGPSMLLKTSSAIGDSVEINKGGYNLCRARARTSMSTIFRLPSGTVNAGDFLMQIGFINKSNPADMTLELQAYPASSPNFIFNVLTTESTAYSIDTGVPIDNNPHSIGITRDGKNDSAGLVFFDGEPLTLTGFSFDNDYDSTIRAKIRTDSAETKEFYIYDPLLRTTSDIYQS